MEILFLIGRILFGGFFLMNGINHLTKQNMFVHYTASKGVPAPKLAVIVSGLLILLGGLGIILGVYVKLALIFIVIFLVPVTLSMHKFWKEADQMRKMSEMVNFMKNTALLGAALIMLAMGTNWVWSLGNL